MVYERMRHCLNLRHDPKVPSSYASFADRFILQPSNLVDRLQPSNLLGRPIGLGLGTWSGFREFDDSD